MRAIAVLMIAGASFLCHAVDGASITGYDLYRQCTALGTGDDAASDRLICVSYLRGYLDGVFQVSHLNRTSPTPIRACPGPIPIGQYLMVFKRWAEQNPAWLSRPAPDALAAAIVEAFPCDSNGTNSR